MPEDIKNRDTAYADGSDLYGHQTQAVPKPEKGIGIDTQGVFYDNIINAGTAGQVDISAIESFTQISQNRDTIYSLLDTMAEDPTIAAVLETYAEDATETNDQGRIVWAEADDAEVGKYITFLLDTIGIDKNVYKWVYSLCKYGDCYLRLYRESEFEDTLFADEGNEDEKHKMAKHLTESLDKIKDTAEKDILNEDVVIKMYSDNDRYAHYLEMVPNPAEMYELTKFGKSYAYIQARVTANAMKSQNANNLTNTTYKYMFQKKDVNVFDATNFVHAALEDNSSRVPEEVQVFRDAEQLETGNAFSYTVKRGQSLLYNSFKIWRELMLLENSLLLNRLTKSSIVRIINVEVGDMPKENVAPHLMGIKQLIEQKSAISEGNSLSEYTNPGPMENNVYVPTHNGLGAISTQQVGGDVDVKGLSDIDYFKNKFFGSLRVPKQYFGDTDDATGFNGGTSLSLISSRYAKMIKRIQNTMLQALTDAINLMLLDKGLDSYINKFDLHMLPPTTSEEIDRRDSLSSKVQISRDIMDLLGDIEDPVAKLKILKALLSTIISDADIIDIVQEEIDKLEEQVENGGADDNGDMLDDTALGGDFMPGSHSGMHETAPGIELGGAEESDFDIGSEEPAEEGGETVLPTPADLGQDFTDNSIEL